MKRLTFLLASILATATALATTYVRVEPDGTKTYSDRPLPGGQPVDLEPAQTYSPPPTSSSGDRNLTAEQRALRGIDDFRYASCTLTPENDATFTNPQNVPIALSTQPDLRPGDQVTLIVDGQVAAQNAMATVLEPANRGSHTVQATIKDSYGRTLCSASTTFHVLRPSIHMPGRR